MSHWRKQAALVIEAAIQANPGATEKELRAALRAAYPFGERAMHPYKIWCSQVRFVMQRLFPKAKGSEDLPLFKGEDE